MQDGVLGEQRVKQKAMLYFYVTLGTWRNLVQTSTCLAYDPIELVVKNGRESRCHPWENCTVSAKTEDPLE